MIAQLTLWRQFPGNDRGKLNWSPVFSLHWVTSGKSYAKPLHGKLQNTADRNKFRNSPLLLVRRMNINRITIDTMGKELKSVKNKKEKNI